MVRVGAGIRSSGVRYNGNAQDKSKTFKLSSTRKSHYSLSKQLCQLDLRFPSRSNNFAVILTPTETEGKGELLPPRQVANVAQFWWRRQDMYLTQGAERLLMDTQLPDFLKKKTGASWEANSRLGSQEITCLLWDTKFIGALQEADIGPALSHSNILQAELVHLPGYRQRDHWI